MRIALAASIAISLFVGLAVSAQADDWRRYDNARFAYAIALPPGFSDIAEAGNGDGGISKASDSKAELRVWGTNIIDGDFSDEVAARVSSDKADGWNIAYDQRDAEWASWSGSKGARIFYQRAIEGCDGSAAFFRLDYDEDQRADYDAIVTRLVKSLRPNC